MPLEGDWVSRVADEMLFRATDDGMADVASEEWLNRVPSKFRNGVLAEFDFDMEQLAERLRRASAPPLDVTRSPSSYVFQTLPGRPEARVVRIGEAARAILEMSDGTTSVRSIVSAVSTAPRYRSHATDVVAQAARETIARMCADGLIWLSPGGCPAKIAPGARSCGPPTVIPAGEMLSLLETRGGDGYGER